MTRCWVFILCASTVGKPVLPLAIILTNEGSYSLAPINSTHLGLPYVAQVMGGALLPPIGLLLVNL